jgi:hypothetical protein
MDYNICFYLLNFIIGIGFGFFHRGKEDFMGILRNGAIAGLVLGIAFVLVSRVFILGGLSLGPGFAGVFDIFLIIIVYVIIFMVGAFIGDRLEGLRKKNQPARKAL